MELSKFEKMEKNDFRQYHIQASLEFTSFSEIAYMSNVEIHMMIVYK